MSKNEREMRVEKRYLKRHSLSGAAAAADQKVNEQQKRRMDGTLLILVLLLVVCGLIFLYSTSAYNGRVKFHDPAYYFKKQLFATSLGMMGMYLVSCMDYHVLTKMAPFLYVVSMGLSLAVLLFGDEYNGSKRWLSIGPLSFQPSEFAKVAVILLLTYVITNSRKRQDSLLHMAGTMALLLPIVGLVGTNNLSTAIIILGIGVILIFVSNPKYLPFVGIGGVGVLFIGIFLSMASYRLERIAIWRNPEKYEKGFQTIQGLYAIGSGGIFGKGLGSSLQKLGFVPEAQNDMIFSIICEEDRSHWCLSADSDLRTVDLEAHGDSHPCQDLCGALIAAGIMGHMAIQVILNIAVVTNTIPNTGITLPFVSYGGTSVLFLMGDDGSGTVL